MGILSCIKLRVTIGKVKKFFFERTFFIILICTKRISGVYSKRFDLFGCFFFSNCETSN